MIVVYTLSQIEHRYADGAAVLGATQTPYVVGYVQLVSSLYYYFDLSRLTSI